MASVAGVFDVLEVFATTARSLNFSQIVRATGKPKGSVHRILSTLVNIGILAQNSVGEYSLTFKLWGLGMVAFAGMDLVKVSQPFITELMEATDETAALAVLDGAECITYLCKSESPRSIRVQFWVGKRVPSWRSATGRTLLAFNADIAQMLFQLPTLSECHIASSEFADLLRKVKAQGYSITKGDNHPEMGGIAAPVRDHTGAIVASCCVAVPKFRMTKALIKRALPTVIRTASAISQALGYIPMGNTECRPVRPRPLTPVG